MTLVVCDLDGTLTRTFAVDGDCYLQAFETSLGVKDVNDKWSEYEHVTDLGVMQEVFQSRFGRAPAPTEIEAFVDCFVGLLEVATNRLPTPLERYRARQRFWPG